MGRRSSRPSGGRRAASPRPSSRSSSTFSRRPAPAPAPARSAAPRSTPSRAASTAPAKQKNTPAPPPATQQPQQGSPMGGFMANVASTGLGVAAGRAIDRAIFGGGSGAAPAPEELAEGGAPAYDTSEFAAGSGDMIEESVCAREALEFKKCMERSSNDVASCQWNIDILAACQQQQAQLGFADAGRL